jgi:hypothetical protein
MIGRHRREVSAKTARRGFAPIWPFSADFTHQSTGSGVPIGMASSKEDAPHFESVGQLTKFCSAFVIVDREN